uniref:Si:dkey-152b24.8 n=1 Tax=Lepisosteus oculatus TaxID=7918 RepID=W5MR46_LEPOC
FMIILKIICITLLAINCSGNRNFFDDTEAPEFNNEDWMKEIPDNTLLSAVNIPGTHDSLSLYCTRLAICQSWTLDKQLQAGIRFLDVRIQCFPLCGDPVICHGITPQFDWFSNVVKVVMNFLQAHKKETVVMRLKAELCETGVNTLVKVKNMLNNNGAAGALWESTDVPKMRQVRGKLVILQEFSGETQWIKYDSLDIGDDYQVQNINEKWTSVQNHLNSAIQGDKEKLFLTFSSGTGISATQIICALCPHHVAQTINNKLFDYLPTLASNKNRLGIIAMDFPSAQLIQKIIELNQQTN